MRKVQYPPLYVGTFAMLLTAIGTVYSHLPFASWAMHMGTWALLYGAGLWCGRLHARRERDWCNIAGYAILGLGCIVVLRIWTMARWDTNFVYLLLFIQGARNFTLATRREFHLAHVISLVVILHAAASETRSVFLFYLVVYSLAGAFTLMADHVDAKLAEAQGGDREFLSKGIKLPGKGISLGITVMLVAGLVYLFTPRPPSPAMQAIPAGSAPQGITGPYDKPGGSGPGGDLARPSSDGTPRQAPAGKGQEAGSGTGGLTGYQRGQPRNDERGRQQQKSGGQPADGQAGGSTNTPSGQSSYYGFKDKFDMTTTCRMDSNRVVFHLNSDRPVYARARTFDTFDGKNWSDTGRQKRGIASADGLFYLGSSYGRKGLPWESVAQVYTLKTDWEGTIFNHHRPENVAFPSSFIEAGSDDTAGIPGIIPKETRYSVLSRFGYVEGRVCSSGRPDAGDRAYMDLPKRLSVRTRELARSLTEGRDDLEAAKAIESHLRSRYTLSNDVPAGSEDRDPVDEFLFSKKKGTPEMFATSMVLMLRSRYIPARLVVGFRATRYNPILGRYDARLLDAHSWVEAFIHNYGWVTFEPTPGFDLPTKKRDLFAFTSIFRYAGERLNWITRNNANAWWSKMVTFFRTFFSYIKERFKQFLHDAWNCIAGVWAGLSIQGVVFLIALAAANALFFVFRRVFAPLWGRLRVEYARRFRKKDLLFVCYRETERTLARRGAKREASCSPSEYVGQVNERFPQMAEDLLKLTSLFNRAVYSRGQSANDSQDAYAACRALLRKKGGATSQ